MPTRRTIFTMAAAALCTVAGCSRKDERQPAATGGPAVDPKEAELAGLPSGLTVIHRPNPVRAARGGRSGRAFTWLHSTTVQSTGEPVTIEEFGALEWDGRRWVFSTITGKPFTAADFAEWYSCPGAVVDAGHECADPLNYSGASALQGSRAKWYFIGRTSSGTRVKGEGVVETLAELVPESVDHPPAK